MISAHKGTEMSVLLSMSGALQRPHIGEHFPAVYNDYIMIIHLT